MIHKRVGDTYLLKAQDGREYRLEVSDVARLGAARLSSSGGWWRGKGESATCMHFGFESGERVRHVTNSVITHHGGRPGLDLQSLHAC